MFILCMDDNSDLLIESIFQPDSCGGPHLVILPESTSIFLIVYHGKQTQIDSKYTAAFQCTSFMVL